MHGFDHLKNCLRVYLLSSLHPSPPNAAFGHTIADAPALQGLMSRVRFVLVGPTHAGNIGSVARALGVAGAAPDSLVLASTDERSAEALDALRHDPQAEALAAGAEAWRLGARILSLREALADTQMSLAFTARPREFEPPRLSLEAGLLALAQAASEPGLRNAVDPPAVDSSAVGLSSEGGRVAVVFGTERSGLTNEELMLCSHVCGLDVNPAFSSLNLAQAVSLVAFSLRQECRRQAAVPAPSPATGGQGRPTARPAAAAAVHGLHDHLMRLAEASGYFNPEVPGRMSERLLRLLHRASPLEDEVQMLRGLCTALEKSSLGKSPLKNS